MGTRADFYAGKGKDAEWLGSIAWDGYRDGIPDAILKATSEPEFREAVAKFIAERDDGTRPEQGWPWPWDDSGTTDCSYWFFDGKVHDENYSGHYVACDVEPNDEGEFPAEVLGDEIEFPDMSARKNMTLGRRSGTIVLGM